MLCIKLMNMQMPSAGQKKGAELFVAQMTMCLAFTCLSVNVVIDTIHVPFARVKDFFSFYQGGFFFGYTHNTSQPIFKFAGILP